MLVSTFFQRVYNQNSQGFYSLAHIEILNRFNQLFIHNASIYVRWSLVGGYITAHPVS